MNSIGIFRSESHHADSSVMLRTSPPSTDLLPVVTDNDVSNQHEVCAAESTYFWRQNAYVREYKRDQIWAVGRGFYQHAADA